MKGSGFGVRVYKDGGVLASTSLRTGMTERLDDLGNNSIALLGCSDLSIYKLSC